MPGMARTLNCDACIATLARATGATGAYEIEAEASASIFLGGGGGKEWCGEWH